MKGDEKYGRRATVVLGPPPRLPLDLLLPQAAARPAEGGAEHDEEADAQDGQEDPWEANGCGFSHMFDFAA